MYLMKKDSRTYFIKVLENGKAVSYQRTKSLRRFLSTCRLIHFTKSTTKAVSIKVTYGLKRDYQNKLSMFDNRGTYHNARDLIQAAVAFTEEI